MSVEISAADDLSAERWDRLIERAPSGTPFHRRAAVETLAEHADAELHPLVGYKGEEPVGVFPVFEMSKGPVPAVFSPPPDLKINHLGPVPCNLDGLKTRKRERRHRQFVEGCLDHLDDAIDPWFTLMRIGYDYPHTRPFDWNDFDITPRYTYVVDLDRDTDDLFAAFSSDARRNVRTVEESDADVFEGDRELAATVLDQVAARHRDQGESFRLTEEFVTDLYDRLPDGAVRTYGVSVDGSTVGGMITVNSETTAYRWQGGVKPDLELPVNDALDWHIMSEAVDRGQTRYDLVGANLPRLCRYKAKFDPEVRTYHRLQRGKRGMKTAVGLYSYLRN